MIGARFFTTEKIKIKLPGLWTLSRTRLGARLMRMIHRDKLFNRQRSRHVDTTLRVKDERARFFRDKEGGSDKATCAIQYGSSRIDRSTVPQSTTRGFISVQRLEIREGRGLATLKMSIWIAQVNGQGFSRRCSHEDYATHFLIGSNRRRTGSTSRKSEKKQRVVIVAVARCNELSSSGDIQRIKFHRETSPPRINPTRETLSRDAKRRPLVFVARDFRFAL